MGGGGRGAGTACRGAFHRRPRPDRSLRIRTTRIKGGPTTARGKTTPRDPSRPGGAWWNSIRPVYHRASTAKNTVAFQKACCLLRRGRRGGGGGGGERFGERERTRFLVSNERDHHQPEFFPGFWDFFVDRAKRTCEYECILIYNGD